MMVGAFFGPPIFGFTRRRSTTAAWRDDASAGCPTMLTMSASASSHARRVVLSRNRATTLWRAGASFLLPHAVSKLRRLLRYSLTLRVERRAFHVQRT